MMKIILVLVFGLLNWSVFSQDTQLQNFAPRTPEASAFLKYGEYPVNLSTGVPNISIPIFTVDAGGYKMPISLDYHASGIKVNQEATMVGLGWNLNTGAQIILSSRDEIDENNPEIDNLNINIFNNYISNHPYAFTSSLLSEYQKSKVKDVYVFSSPTVNGNFYFNNNDVVVFPPDAFKVELSDINIKNLSFKITDKLGNIYIFNNTKEVSYRWLTHHDYYTSAWYVDQIKTPKNENIYFTYQNDGEIVENSISEYREIINAGEKCGCTMGASESNSISSVKQSLEKTYTNTKKLKEITFNNNQSKIEFILRAGREDLINQNSLLESIKIKNKGDGVESEIYNTINQIFFEYSYFNPTTTASNAPTSKRLKLERMFDLDGTNIHSFVYSDINLPAKDSKSQDYFGYFNGATNSDLIPKHFINNTIIGSANRDVNVNTTQAGILKEIHYPTKGWTKFNYENNTFFGVDELGRYSLKNESCTAIGSGPANIPAVPWEEGVACPYPTCIIYNSINFNANNSNGSLSYQIRNYGNTGSAAIKYKFCRITVYSDGNLIYDSGKKNVNFDGQVNLGLNNNCIIQLEAYGSDMHINANMSYADDDTSLKNVKGSGLRIQSIENYTDNNTMTSKKTYDYNDKDDSNKTSGKSINPLPFSFVSNEFKNFTSGICPSEISSFIPYVDFTKAYTVSSQSRNSSESNNVTYRFVKETTLNSTNPTENIISDYEFTTDEDWILPNFNIQINLNWKRGKLLEKNDYKFVGGSRFIIKKEKNSYFEDNSKIAYYTGFKFVKRSAIDISENPSNPFEIPLAISTLGSCGIPQNVYESYLLYNYNYSMPWFYQKSSESTDYFYNSSNVLSGSVVNKINYFYDNPNHLQLTRAERTNSNNETLVTKYYYPDDLLAFPLMSSLKIQNRVGEIIKTETLKNTALISTLISTKNTIYKDWGNNIIAPEIIQSSKGSESLENRVRYTILDNTNGHPIELQQEAGTKIVYIWGYNKTQPIAKIEDSSYSTITSSLITSAQTASDTGTEAGLLTALTALRNALPNAMVTTYTYKPLIGVSTITDPKGDKITYEYDEFNRLQFVKDKNGNILSENEYHYKN